MEDTVNITFKELMELLMSNTARNNFMIMKATEIAEHIGALFGYDIDELRSKARCRDITSTRSIIMWYMRKSLGMPLSVIGKSLGRSHATVLRFVKQVDSYIYVRDSLTLQKIATLNKHIC